MGSSVRNSLNKSETPGPGQYDQIRPISAKFKNQPLYSFGGKHQDKVTEYTPGVGSYNPKIFPKKSYPSFSFGVKGNTVNKSSVENPGPGQYNASEYGYFTKKPTTKIGTSKRIDYQAGDTPGPGSYSVRRPASSGPQYRFTQQTRGQLEKEAVLMPGPGTYNLKSTLDLSHGSTLVPRRQEDHLKEAIKVPGPGSYNPLLAKSQQGVKIGSSARNQLSQTDIPGPGTYEPKYKGKKNEPQYRIGTSVRQALSYTLDNPGPGSYNIPQKVVEGPKYTVSGRYEYQPKENMPGPGQYQPKDNLTFSRLPSPMIGSGQRTKYEATHVPGPGNYNVKSSTEGPKWGFGSQARIDSKKNTTNEPGPGTYNIPSMIADVPKYLLNSSVTKNQ